MNFVFAGVPFLLTALVAGTLAAVVFYHGAGKTPNRCLAAMLLGAAATALPLSLAAFTSGDVEAYRASAWNDVEDLFWYLMWLAAIPLALSWPAPRPWAPRAAGLLWPWATAAMLSAALVAVDQAHGVLGPADSLLGLRGAWRLFGRVMFLGALSAAILLAYEARREPDPPLREGRILMALGLGLHAVNIAARDVTLVGPRLELAAVEDPFQLVYVLVVTPLVAAGALALAVLLWRGPPGRARRAARWLLAAAALSGVLDSVMLYARRFWGLPLDYEARLFLYALWMLVPTALLAYVVLRGQIEGLNVKVRFAISKSTVAAVFIAVFFVASEAAQQFFGETIGSQYLGIAAAGALVFAIAPLQRVADRLAEKAVPGAVAGPPAADASPRAEEAYRAVLHRYLRDGTLTRDEERALAILAGELKLDAGRAFELREEVERDVGALRGVR